MNITLNHDFETLIEQILLEKGLVLVQFEMQSRSKKMKVTIHHPKRPVSFEDCEQVHKAIIEELSDVSFEWSLDVQSPGLERRLRTEREFSIFAGRLVEIFYIQELKKPNLIARLVEKDTENLSVVVGQEAQKQEIPLTDISKVCLTYDPELAVLCTEIAQEDII